MRISDWSSDVCSSDLRGAIVALAGLTIVPICIVTPLEILYVTFSHVAALVHVLAYMGAAAAGLVIGVGLRMLRRLPARPMAYAVAGAAFVPVAMLEQLGGASCREDACQNEYDSVVRV